MLDNSMKKMDGAPLVFLISSSRSLFISSLKSYKIRRLYTYFDKINTFYFYATYLNNSLHHSFLLSHWDWTLSFFLWCCWVYVISGEIKVEESCVIALSPVEFSGLVFVGLESDILLWGNSIFAVHHHLC